LTIIFNDVIPVLLTNKEQGPKWRKIPKNSPKKTITYPHIYPLTYPFFLPKKTKNDRFKQFSYPLFRHFYNDSHIQTTKKSPFFGSF